MADALRTEWIKLRTLSSTGWLLLAAVVATVALSAAAVSATSCARSMACAVDPAKLSLNGIQFDQAVVEILAVLAISNEYPTSMIRVTLTAMLRRDHVLAVKVMLFAGLVTTAGVAGAGGPVLAGRLILPSHGFTAARGFHLVSPGYGSTLSRGRRLGALLALIALLSLGVGTRQGLGGIHRHRARVALLVPDHPALHR